MFLPPLISPSPPHQPATKRRYRHHAIETLRGRVNRPLQHRDARTVHETVECVEFRQRFVNGCRVTHVEHQRLATRFFCQTSEFVRIACSRDDISMARA